MSIWGSGEDLRKEVRRENMIRIYCLKISIIFNFSKKVLVAKPDNLTSIHGTHTVEKRTNSYSLSPAFSGMHMSAPI